MFLRPTGAKIWERSELSSEPHTLCYTPRRPKGGERSGARLKGASSKKYFSFIFILTGFLFNNHKFVFLFWILGRGVRGECPKSKTPYFCSNNLFTVLDQSERGLSVRRATASCVEYSPFFINLDSASTAFSMVVLYS